MPLFLTLGCGLTSAGWAVYAYVVGDYFILTPSVIGFLLSLAQLAIYAAYCGLRDDEGTRYTEIAGAAAAASGPQGGALAWRGKAAAGRQVPAPRGYDACCDHAANSGGVLLVQKPYSVAV